MKHEISLVRKVNNGKAHIVLGTVHGRKDDRGRIIGRNGIPWQDRRRAV